ncbi:MAG: hypothetical protein R6X18_05100 [Chloroflexota bacterium]
MESYTALIRSSSGNSGYGCFRVNRYLLIWLTIGFLPIHFLPGQPRISLAPARKEVRETRISEGISPAPEQIENEEDGFLISPYWGPEMQIDAANIIQLSKTYGMHPDLTAAVLRVNHSGKSQAVDLPGDESILGYSISDVEFSEINGLSRSINPHWDMAILSFTIQQAGGDVFTALAAYNSGWRNLNSREAREYATRVLDNFARALIARQGVSPEIADQWTMVISLSNGNVPGQRIYYQQSQLAIKDLHQAVIYSIYASVDGNGRGYYVQGHVLPVGLSTMISETSDLADPDQLEAPLRARLGEKNARKGMENPRLLLACLQSIERLRGNTTTRWYSPSVCPPADRE